MSEGEREAILAAIDRLNALLQEIDTGRPQPATAVALKVAAHASGFSPERVRQWAAQGVIDAKRCGGRWYVNLPVLIAFVAQRRTRTA